MPYYFDWTYLLLLPGLLLGLWAQYKVKSAFQKYRKISTSRGQTAEQVSRQLLAADGIGSIPIEPVAGELDKRNAEGIA